MPSEVLKLEGEDLAGTKTFALPFAAGFYFAFGSFILVLTVHLLGTDPRTGTEIDLCLDYLLLIVVAFCTLGPARMRVREMARISSLRWALFFLGFSGLSLAWSSTASLSTSLAYWCAMAGNGAIVVMLFRAYALEDVSVGLMSGYVWGVSAVALIAWIMPAQSDLRLGDEDLFGANSIGYICGFAFFFAQYLMREKKARMILPSVLLAMTLLRSLSKTTIVAFLASQGLLLISDKSISRRGKLLVTLAAVAAVAVSWGLLSSYFDIYSSAGNQSTTFSGRTGIWAYFLVESIAKPWIGHGFDSVWKVVPPFGPDQFEAPHAHNELLQQFYAYGAAGILLFAGVYISFYRQIRRLAKGSLRTLLIALLLFVLVRGLADTERFDFSLPMWAILMLSLVIEQACSEPVTLSRGNFALRQSAAFAPGQAGATGPPVLE
jgi:exopolysaccharide production protein ExoQ